MDKLTCSVSNGTISSSMYYVSQAFPILRYIEQMLWQHWRYFVHSAMMVLRGTSNSSFESSPNDLYCVEWDAKPYSTTLNRGRYGRHIVSGLYPLSHYCHDIMNVMCIGTRAGGSLTADNLVWPQSPPTVTLLSWYIECYVYRYKGWWQPVSW